MSPCLDLARLAGFNVERSVACREAVPRVPAAQSWALPGLMCAGEPPCVAEPINTYVGLPQQWTLWTERS